MASLVLRTERSGTRDFCALCGQPAAVAGGIALSLAGEADVVCRACGKQHAPSLTALLDLAWAAERVGRIGRHNLTPPLTALLDLAQAAENYSFTTLTPVSASA